MIFRQWEQVIKGTKTQTRRALKPNHVTNRWHMDGEDDQTLNEICTDTGRGVYAVGKTYPVIPKMYKPAVHRRLTFSGDYEYTIGKPGGNGGEQWHPCRIRIMALRVERLWGITEEDAVAEGFIEDDICLYSTPVLPDQRFMTARRGYEALWDSINGKSKLYRWDANPEVVVLTFEMVQA